ncbi:MAG: VacJ family lipoprotein [Gammaproteobacteria bacterium]|nr:VacJ family lipoprotein [Gammaproteobacteria bacterium]
MNKSRFHPLLLLLWLPLIGGCATLEGPPDPDDPFESYNRAMYKFNDSLDRVVLKPVAEGYVNVTPTPVRKGVTNFFSNLDDVVVVVNDVLQLKLVQAASDLTRFVVNSTLGIAGIFDVASPMGLRKHNEDFGQTLGRWGVGSGPYLVLPYFGPSSPRDGVGLYVDLSEIDPRFNQIDDNATRNTLVALNVVNTRAGLLNASSILDVAALDPYIFTRDAWKQRRQFLVYDGDPPEEEFDDEFDDELDLLEDEQLPGDQ